MIAPFQELPRVFFQPVVAVVAGDAHMLQFGYESADGAWFHYRWFRFRFFDRFRLLQVQQSFQPVHMPLDSIDSLNAFWNA